MKLDHERLSVALKAARAAREWRQHHVTAAAKAHGLVLARRTIQRYERGEPFKQLGKARGTLLAFDVVYEWTPGSSERTLKGGEPTPMSKSGDGPAVDLPPAESLEDEDGVEIIAQAVAGLALMSPEQRLRVLTNIHQELATSSHDEASNSE